MTPIQPSADIIDFGQHRPGLDRSRTVLLRSYWEDARKGSDMPRRNDIDPREISRVLSDCFMLERVKPGDVRFRLTGMNVNDLLGMEGRGMPITSLIAPASRRAFLADFEEVFSIPSIKRYQLRAEACFAEVLALPLKGDDDQVDRAIGCLIKNDTKRETPARFDVLECATTRVDMFGPDDTVTKAQIVSGQDQTYGGDDGHIDLSASGHLRIVKD